MLVNLPMVRDAHTQRHMCTHKVIKMSDAHYYLDTKNREG